VAFFRFGSALAALALVVSLAACTSHGSDSSSTTVAQSAASPGGYPDAVALGNAASDDDDWILPQKTYANNRYSGLSEITPQNAGTLAKAWVTEIADDGEQEAAPLVWHGTMYVATPHDSVLALDAATGELKWQFPYSPQYVLAFAVNRGVGLADGKIFLATQDCRVIALDATTGKQAWNVDGCPNEANNDKHNNWFSMAAYVYKDTVILGTAGGDFGNVGHVTAFSTADGHRVWDWQTIPGPGQPGHETWPGNSWQHGGAAVWSGITIDPETQTVFVAPGNPGPDLTTKGREGKNLYTNSLVALDIASGRPKVRWYYQLVQNDTHDADPAMYPMLFDGKVGGTDRKLVAIGDKAANFAILDRTDGKLLYRMAVDNQAGITNPPSRNGTPGCPNHGGGIEWNGGAYDPASNYFLLPSTEECATWKLLTDTPKFVPGQPFEGGPLPKRRNGTGKVTAIDVGTGKVAWTHALPYPGEGGVTVTKSGVAFTTDLGGHLYAFAPQTGKVLWQGDTGSSNVAAPTVYRAGGAEYVALLSGEAGNQQTPNIPKTHGSVLTAYKLGPVASPRVNTAAKQNVAGANQQNGNQPPSIGSAPYTPQQVAAGSQIYGQSCASCHGAQLQGISAPALTGPAMARNKLDLSQARTIVTTQMPLNAPGSLKPDQYAAVMAYMLSYDCVAHSQVGSEAFPNTDRPEFKKVVFGGRSCPPKPGTGGHE
jgi:alcohol dehydrogenase (cytochrome c)